MNTKVAYTDNALIKPVDTYVSNVLLQGIVIDPQ